jgi:hypothetical protein
MINPFTEINWKPGLDESRKFARSLVLGFPIVAVLLLLAGRWHTGVWNLKASLIIGGAGVCVGFLLLAIPQIARPFYMVWYFVGACVGIVLGNLLLAGAFYVLITGIGLLKRAFGRQAIRKSLDRAASTYWQDAEPAKDPQQYYSQY